MRHGWLTRLAFLALICMALPVQSRGWVATHLRRTFWPASAFSFTNQTDVNPSTATTSNTVTLAGGFANLTATCGTGCTAISRNGGGFSAGPVTGFYSGDTIAIRLTSSANYSTAVTATVSVGGTTSGTWSVTTRAANNCTGTAWGTVNHGSSVTAYSASSVACGSTCTSQSRTCTDGTLSGSYAYTSCSVASCDTRPTECSNCGGSWNGSSCTGAARCELDGAPTTSSCLASYGGWSCGTNKTCMNCCPQDSHYDMFANTCTK